MPRQFSRTKFIERLGGMTYRQLFRALDAISRKHGIIPSTGYVSRIYRGATKPGLQYIAAIADVLGCELEDLREDKE